MYQILAVIFIISLVNHSLNGLFGEWCDLVLGELVWTVKL